ncbi:MAG TPA: glycosyltransferase family A protein, partial [Thermoleophilaceae bacterium]|nr:glycosyltransferase family A protein [Thermoleophilaceae bacterium]
MLSIVIPTRDRAATLAETLSCVLAQRAPAGGFEVVVVDNGSTDRTPELLLQLAADHGPRFRHVLEQRPGPAAARNAGVAAARGELVMFLGDDMEPATDDLLLDHVALHQRHPEPEYAVLGRVAWNERLPVTPLMRWLETGPQFAFELLEPGPVEPSAYLYTAQLSLKRAVFESVGGFDTRFPYAAVEDMELGIRLAAKGLILDYRPELLVLHTHPTPLARWLERMRLTGRSVALLERIHPEPSSP